MYTLFLALFYLATTLIFLILLFNLPFSPLSNKNGVPRNWPVLGTLPALLANFHNLIDWAVVIANETRHSTFLLKAPWFSKTNLLITMDPANVQYTSSSRFSNFPRGAKSRQIFDVFGDSYFNLDSNEWMAHRKIHRSFFGHKMFNESSTELAFEKTDKGIAVVLDHVATGGCLGRGKGGVIDLKDLFSRYTSDLTHRLIIGSDPMYLSLEWCQVQFSQAMSSAMESVWMRHFLPEPLWKIQRKLGLGHEKALDKAKHFLNKFSAKTISLKHDEYNMREDDANSFKDMVTTYFDESEIYRSRKEDEVLKGSLLTLLLAGSDTTSAALTWLFWVLSRHPNIEENIRQEIARIIPSNGEREKSHVFTPIEISKLVYLHATVCETLRLYPPIPFQTRSPLELDILPSGHKVSPNSTMIIIPLYVMARMVKVWGKDCAEFRPERWIGEDGGIKHEPSHKFFSFNSGPRICLGREVALTQIKVAAATILHNYNVHIVEGQTAVPSNSVSFQMKYGLMARITKRWARTINPL